MTERTVVSDMYAPQIFATKHGNGSLAVAQQNEVSSDQGLVDAALGSQRSGWPTCPLGPPMMKISNFLVGMAKSFLFSLLCFGRPVLASKLSGASLVRRQSPLHFRSCLSVQGVPLQAVAVGSADREWSGARQCEQP